MPLQVKKLGIQVKNNSGTFVPADLLYNDSLNYLDAAKTAAVAAVEEKGAEILASIPEDYTKVAGDVADLKSAMLVNYESYNFTIQNSRVAPATGAFVNNNKSWRTDYIPCEARETVDFRGKSCWYNGNPIGALIAFYNAEKQFISSIAKFSDTETTNTTGILTVNAPENTAYIIAGTYDIVNDSYIRIKNREKLIESIPEIDARLETAEKSVDKIGYYENTFGVAANTAHSIQLDKLAVNITAGESFTVKVTGVATGGQIYGYYNNLASNVLLSQTLNFVGTSTQNLDAISVHFDASDLPSSGDIILEVWKNDFLYGKSLPNEKTIITSVLGATIPNELSKYNVSSSYANAMKNAIDAWMASYAGDDKAIPFIVHTDQHGRLTAARQGIFNLLDYLVNWDGISAIFNLGDTVVDHWEDDNTNANPLLRNATLEAARICLENIPKEKRIDVYGNHDTWYSNGSVYTPVEGTLPSMQYNNPYFPSDGLITRKCPDNSGLAVVYDTKRNVKYLILAGWDYADKIGTHVGYQWYWINQKHLNWIVDEMSKNDGYDLILVSHVPLQMGGAGCINPITGDSISETVPFYITHYDPYLLPLWNARKNKTSGTVSSNGVSITYDFTGCESDCICALSGHAHYDGAQYIQNAATGLLDVAFDWFFNNTIHFGIIDRNSRKIKVWKLANDSTPTVTPWELPLDYSVDYRSKSFRVKKNVSHSALNDKMPVNIASGERFTVKVAGPINAFQIYGFLNGDYTMIAQNVFTYTGTASQAFDEIGISVGGQYILGTGDVIFEAYKS